MNKKHLQFSIAYAIVFVLVVLARINNWSLLNEISTPCITVVLLLFLSIATRLKGRFHQRLFTGLVFSLTGDALILMKNHNPSYFLYGLVAHVIGYIFYISAFYLDFRSAQELDKKGARIAILSSLISCTTFYFILRPHLGIYKLPVIAHAFIMALLVMMASFRNQRVNAISFNLILSGAILLVFSTAALAYSHFIQPFQLNDTVVMVTYMAAQYLLILGGVERQLLRTASDS
ncbi:lysoplasmalogenase [Pedobacter sp. AW31-3R]|uniref:lysoplasmalogenase n=1 Tax=Pedobacter sp. AW31-3R TaxID=3445781 RepID=UPI003FA0763D